MFSVGETSSVGADYDIFKFQELLCKITYITHKEKGEKKHVFVSCMSLGRKAMIAVYLL